MSGWNEGYVTEIDYTSSYHRELSPNRVRLALINAGLAPPDIRTACELGFGMGSNITAHAAATDIDWYGTDFNPAHVASAQALLDAAGAKAHLFDQSFEEFCARDDLPDFDFIALHGIFSWVSRENQAVIVDFLRRKLRVGGVVYISYNTYPGWSGIDALQHLMAEHSQTMGSVNQGVVGRVGAAVDFAKDLIAQSPRLRDAVPDLAGLVGQLKSRNPRYLAHEYFNEHFQPLHFSQMAGMLDGAKLSFAASANYLDALDTLNLTSGQRDMMAGVTDPVLRQTMRDYMVNQNFRKDYWVRGARSLSRPEQDQALETTKLVLMQPREQVSRKIRTGLGEVELQPAALDPVLEVLSDHQPRNIQEILASMGGDRRKILQSLVVLIGGGAVEFAAEPSAEIRQRVARMNGALARAAQAPGGGAGHLVSPVTGGGLTLAREQLLYTLAMQDGHQTPAALAAAVAQVLNAERKAPLNEDELAKLAEGVRAYVDTVQPVLSALGIM